MALWYFFSGKKTYLIAALMVALGFLNGDTQQIAEGLAFATVRHGISKL